MRLSFKGETRNLKIIGETKIKNNNTGEKSIDEDIYSYWEANYLPAEIIYDVGNNINLGGVYISLFQNKEFNYYYGFSIYISVDNKNWSEEIKRSVDAPFSIKGECFYLRKKARYIKVVCLESKQGNGFFLRDFKIFSDDIKTEKLLDYESLKNF